MSKSSPQITLGTSDGKDFRMDLDALIRQRMLIQANSGGGKSWLLRRLAEQLFGKVPVLIVDPEGEFATLREKFGYVLVGKGGETPADSRSAAMVAHKLLELRASAVCDLYELKPHERHHWVKLFLEGLINAPKNLWRPTVVIIDEAHVFCPEGKAGESEASGAVVDLATRGRKRRFCCILATQRLGKLRKDATAELLNRLVGPTFEDVDLDRAADLLSVASHDRREFFEQMRVLASGNFYALGRALCLKRTLVKVGPVQTSHEIEDAKFGTDAPPAPDEIKSLLPKLADLPKAAEDKARTEGELRREIQELKRQLKQAVPAPNAPAKVETKRVEVPVLKEDHVARLEKFIEKGVAMTKAMQDIVAKFKPTAVSLTGFGGMSGRYTLVKAGPATRPPVERNAPLVKRNAPEVKQNGTEAEHADFHMGKGERAILTACIHHPEGCARDQLTVLTGYKRSSRDTYIQRLVGAGLVEASGPDIIATDAGRAALPDAEPLPTGEDLQRHWLARLGGGERAIFEVLLAVYPEQISRDTISEQTNYKRSSRDTYLQRLSSRKLIEDCGRGMVRASERLFA